MEISEFVLMISLIELQCAVPLAEIGIQTSNGGATCRRMQSTGRAERGKFNLSPSPTGWTLSCKFKKK